MVETDFLSPSYRYLFFHACLYACKSPCSWIEAFFCLFSLTRFQRMQIKALFREHNTKFFAFFFLTLHLSLARNLGHLTWVRLQQLQEQRYPFLTVHAIFSCVEAMVCLPMLGIFNVRTDVFACDCTRGLYRHLKRVCTESWLGGKKSLAASAVCGSDAVPA